MKISRKLLFTLFMILLLCLPGLASAKAGKKNNTQNNKTTITYEVRKGDTLGKIAQKYDARVEDIVRWNNLPNEHQIRIGQKLRIRVPANSSYASSSASTGSNKIAVLTQNVEYVVKKGDTLGKIAHKTGVSVAQIQKLNPKLKKNPNQLRIGQKIVLDVKRFEKQSGVSRGLANNGSLAGGMQLSSGDYYVVRDPNRAYGTSMTVYGIMRAMDTYGKKYPKGPKFFIGDLSKKGGGKFPPHLSHQSGRDVDISYVKAEKSANPGFAKMNAHNFDVERNWTVIKAFLDSKQIQYIFVDYELQELLYKQAIKEGMTPAQLKPLIQYPNGKKSYGAIVRHAKGHADHFHVRFVCASSDVNCH